ncbi:MAG: ribosomal-processing cysteine protease Prp [Treponema sp.]
MIIVRLKLDNEGRLIACTASGHAGIEHKGQDIVCAAASILLRTTVYTLRSVDAIALQYNAEQRGFVSFSVAHYEAAESKRLQYAAEFLWLGLHSLQQEYPQAIVCEKYSGKNE